MLATAVVKSHEILIALKRKFFSVMERIASASVAKTAIYKIFYKFYSLYNGRKRITKWLRFDLVITTFPSPVL